MRKFLLFFLVLLTAASPLAPQTYKVIHNFGAQAGDPVNPKPGLISQTRGGAMLTTSPDIYPNDGGKAFRIWPSGSVQILHQFENPGVVGSDGPVVPRSGLIMATDGKFYGTTVTGGKFGRGMVFKMSQDGTVKTLHEFTGGSDGEYPRAAPIQSVKGAFYGTTQTCVYRITKDGNFTLLHAFTGNEGSYPVGPLVQGTDYRFYGTTWQGGAHNMGTIFRVSSSDDFKVLVNFYGPNGAFPFSGLIQASDGNFYGVASGGGSLNSGVLFRMKPGGTLTVLHSFGGIYDGSFPVGGLVQASDGNLYGTTAEGYSSLFRATLAGEVTSLHKFDFETGYSAYSTLLQHTKGMLYGATYDGGQFGKGVFYSFDAGLPPFVTYLPTYGRAGALVQILGQGFTSGSQVSFNGKLAASPVVVYPTYLRVVVPSGATTGPITVTTANGTLTSNKVFIVHPY